MSTGKSKKTETPPIIIGYEFGLGVVEILLGTAILLFGNRAIAYYEILESNGFLSEYQNLISLFEDKVLPYISQHHLSIAIFLFAIGAAKIISCIGLWMQKEWGNHILVGLLVIFLPFDSINLIKNPNLFDLIFVQLNILIIVVLTDYHPGEYFMSFWKYLERKIN